MVDPERVTLLVVIPLASGGTEVGVLTGVKVRVAVGTGVVVDVMAGVGVGVLVRVGVKVAVGDSSTSTIRVLAATGDEVGGTEAVGVWLGGTVAGVVGVAERATEGVRVGLGVRTTAATGLAAGFEVDVGVGVGAPFAKLTWSGSVLALATISRASTPTSARRPNTGVQNAIAAYRVSTLSCVPLGLVSLSGAARRRRSRA